MGRMLRDEVRREEGGWVGYGEEEMEIRLEVGELVWEEFLMENVMAVKKLAERSM